MGCCNNKAEKCKKCTTPCGCKINIESFSCVTYSGPNIPSLTIVTGDNLESVMNKIAKVIDLLDDRISLLEP